MYVMYSYTTDSLTNTNKYMFGSVWNKTNSCLVIMYKYCKITLDSYIFLQCQYILKEKTSVKNFDYRVQLLSVLYYIKKLIVKYCGK